jgi:hypothetical protein
VVAEMDQPAVLDQTAQLILEVAEAEAMCLLLLMVVQELAIYLFLQQITQEQLLVAQL